MSGIDVNILSWNKIIRESIVFVTGVQINKISLTVKKTALFYAEV